MDLLEEYIEFITRIPAVLQVLGACIAICLVSNCLLNWKMRILKKQRGGEGIEDFLKYFENQGIPEIILRETYHQTQSGEWVRDFPVRPSDDLGGIYGIVEDDLDDLIIDLAKACGCRTPIQEDLREPVKTVEDLVRLLVRLKRQSE